MNAITRIRPRRAMSTERSIARAFRADAADRVCRGLMRLAQTAEPPARQRLTDLAYLEGAKADVLRALADGYLGEARSALACWRALHRSLCRRAGTA